MEDNANLELEVIDRIIVEDLKPIPSEFLNCLESRTKLLHQILDKLQDDHVGVVGLFGMGGTGKTTLAKEVNKRGTNIFSIKVMVEVSDVPDIVRIQATIAESIDLPLHDIDNVGQRAVRLYNKLISEKEEKILIILDNVCKKLNLDEIGIPCTSKLLITTREREVCTIMDVQDVNVLEVGLMNTNEARELFKYQAGNEVDTREYMNVVERLLSSCGGLPLAIVTMATLLKDKDLPSWEKFADELEKTSFTNDYRHTKSILDMGYKLIKGKEKRIFFLLACLSSKIGSSVSIESLMRYGIGLNLFQHVNKLCEAMEQAYIWSNELMLSSMLLEDVKGEAMIHDIVRAFAILFAAEKEGHKFMVEGLPGWPDNKSFEDYTGMSLTSRNNYSRLSGVEGRQLQILILKGDMSPSFNKFFFEEMVNLEVLALSNMNFQPDLPKSIWKLKKLRTLCMEGCKLGDIKQIGELVDLLVLSLRESFLEDLPTEIGELSKLRLLDLSGCTCSKVPLIPADVLGRLSKLEGLYLFHNKQEIAVLETKVEDERSAVEDIKLPCLNAFEIRVANPNELQIDAQSLRNVDKFKVYVGNKRVDNETLQYCRVLNLCDIDELRKVLAKNCLNVLRKKADCLMIKSSNNFENIVPQLDQEGFRDLSSLKIGKCCDVKCIVNGHEMNDLIAFPCLRSLHLRELVNLKMVCDGETPSGMFSSLQTLKLHFMEKLLYGLPFVPHNLNEICVSFCELLNFIFIENEETQVIELRFLKTLKLTDMTGLLSLVGPKQLSNTYDALQTNQIFFDGKIAFPSLELFEMKGCDNIVKLWSKGIYTSGFQNLKDIKIVSCKKLLSVGPPSLFSILVHLETLSIKWCTEMREIITLEETEVSEIGDRIIKFPQLKYLDLECLGSLKSFYAGGLKLEFPKLKRLKLANLHSMNRFAKLEKPSASCHEYIKFPCQFPCLEELDVRFMNIMELWDWQESNHFPRLRQLTLEYTAMLRYLPCKILNNISSLTLIDFDECDVLISYSDVQQKGECLWTYDELYMLEVLRIENSSLKELFVKYDCLDWVARGFYGNLKTLVLDGLSKLELVKLEFFMNLVSLTLYGLKWEYLVSADCIGNMPLQFLSIDGCDNMEALVIDFVSAIELPELKRLILHDLGSMKSFSSALKRDATLHLPSLESLKIENCKDMEYFWSGVIVAPKLQHVSVLECHNLKCFLPGNLAHDGDLQLPSLKVLNIAKSPNLSSFSFTPLVAPKLTHVQYDEKEYSMFPSDNLNHFFKKINAE